MKILKILLILLVPAMGIVGCKKSVTRPDCPAHEGSASANKPEDNNNTVSARIYSDELGEDETTPVEIIGSGEDDRDGGDKRRKR